MRVVISGASGNLGRMAAELALERFAPGEVILTSRTPETLDDLAERGATVRFADFDRPESVAPAFAGAERLLMVSATNATGVRMDQHGAAIDGARDAGVRHVLLTSMPRVEDVDHPTGLLAEEYRDTEALLRASGLAWTMLRNAPYSELHVVERMADAIRAGEIVSNATSGGISFISRRDCAAAAVGALAGDGHEGKAYTITGPAAITFAEVAATLSDVLGRPIAFTGIDDDAMARHLREIEMPELFAGMFLGFGIAVRRGYYADVTTAVEDLSGAPPTPFAEIIGAHREEIACAS